MPEHEAQPRLRWVRWQSVGLAAVSLLFVGSLAADSGGPVGKKVYRSSSGSCQLEVDPRWDRSYSETDPRLTLQCGGDLVWQRTASDFESFDFPMHALVNDDGRFVVFGGYSVHNFGNYDEGLRFYDAEGRLIRFVSRLDLPPGPHSVSTAHWFDSERTVLVGHELHFYTPDREGTIRFDVRTGEASPADRIVAGQGDDEENWRRGWANEPGVSQAPAAAEEP